MISQSRFTLYFGSMVTYEKMGDMGHVQWPCPTLDHPGTPYLYKESKFDTPSGKGQLFAAAWRAPAEVPDDAYPLVLCTVREVGHYSCPCVSSLQAPIHH